MKKLLFTMALAALPFVAKAGVPAWEMNPHYVGGMHVGYGTSSKYSGVKTYTGRVMLGTFHGVKFNDYLETALGVDGHMLTHYYKNQSLRWDMTAYAQIRGFYPVTSDFAPMLHMAYGAAISLKPSNGSNFYCEFGPGFRYKKLNFSCGLQHYGSGKGTNHFFVKTGFYF